MGGASSWQALVTIMGLVTAQGNDLDKIGAGYRMVTKTGKVADRKRLVT